MISMGMRRMTTFPSYCSVLSSRMKTRRYMCGDDFTNPSLIILPFLVQIVLCHCKIRRYFARKSRNECWNTRVCFVEQNMFQRQFFFMFYDVFHSIHPRQDNFVNVHYPFFKNSCLVIDAIKFNALLIFEDKLLK